MTINNRRHTVSTSIIRPIFILYQQRKPISTKLYNFIIAGLAAFADLVFNGEVQVFQRSRAFNVFTCSHLHGVDYPNGVIFNMGRDVNYGFIELK